jgi:hypothetical protein
VRKAYGVPATLGLLPGRVTYVIDREGTVRHLFNSQFNPKGHIDAAWAFSKIYNPLDMELQPEFNAQNTNLVACLEELEGAIAGSLVPQRKRCPGLSHDLRRPHAQYRRPRSAPGG